MNAIVALSIFMLGAAQMFGHPDHRERPSMSYAPITFKFSRPLLNLSTCASIVDESPSRILALIESGDLRVAFDIAAPGGCRREIRVLTKCLYEFVSGSSRVVEPRARVRAEVEAIFPSLSITLQTPTLERLFNCDKALVYDLSREKCLSLARQGRRGRGGSAQFTRRSCVEFLISRRLT